MNDKILAALKKALGPQDPTRVRTPNAEDVEIYQALSALGDEMLADFREGRMPREEALRIARQRRADLDGMGVR